MFATVSPKDWGIDDIPSEGTERAFGHGSQPLTGQCVEISRFIM
ncbi:MAG: hypothetical protein ACFWUE_00590 [Xylanivirga thermophila]|jgi:hypothetical protein